MSLNSLDLSYNHFGELGGINLAAGLVSRLYIYIKTSVFGACIGCFFDQEQTFVVNKTLRAQVLPMSERVCAFLVSTTLT